MSTLVELEIKSLLDELGSPEAITPRLISFIEDPENAAMTKIGNQALARFLLLSGQPTALIKFITRHLDDPKFPIPWAYFLEAISMVFHPLSDDLSKYLREGIQEQEADDDACRAKSFDPYEPKFTALRNDRKHKAAKEFQRRKQQMLDELHILRTQQLYEQEKLLLEKLKKMDPHDPAIKKEYELQKERRALDILSRHKPSIRNLTISEDSNDPNSKMWSVEFAQSLATAAQANSEMAYDFAVACYVLEQYEKSLAILQQLPPETSRDWLYLEVLLHCRRFAELLSEIAQVELRYATEPETFFASAYLRAQALWGLGQKHSAIEVLEGLLASRPHYRAGATLLNNWRGL